ncbi:MAG: PD-(D/E)XK nuclease family protein [Planctomycetota bacterium]|nr:PD-(D/E)XK nuclease family protein [Planctomycetota bacterium]
MRDSVTGWLTLLDKYLTEYVQRRVSRHLIGPPHITGPLKAVVEAIDTLLPPELAGAPMQAKKRRLSEWSAPIADALTKLYARRPLDRHHPDDAPLVYALRALGQALREQAQLDNVGANAATTAAANADPSNLALSLSDAIALTLSRVRDLAPPPPEPASAAVEILGWLELQLDDAPHLIVTGVNEGMIPESVNHDAFLPDSLRRDLGLLDNRRRHARDLMALTAILHSRPHVRLVAGRRSADDDPLTPSRLLLACAGDELARRIGRFYDHSEEPAPPPPLLPTGKRSRLVIPPPVAPLAAIEELNVTAFRDYLACPYRFYLKHVCKLDTLDDRAVELSAPAFGNLAHKVLENFGQGPLATSDNPADIADFLNEELDRACRLTYGQQPTVAITLQREQLRQRLAAFARWQAQETRDGWSIAIQTEKRFAAPFPVDGQPFRIVGRIDRIDRHPEKGLRILDYKTGDKGEFPEKTHRFKGEWVDLQLPLYRLLARAAGLEGACALGYVLLPKKLAETGLAAAEWSEEELAHAEEEARRIVRAIRQSIFWPPTEPPKFDDGLGSICMDLSLDRARVIRAGGSGGEGSAGT